MELPPVFQIVCGQTVFPVLAVADDRVTHVEAVDAQLVRPSGQRHQLQPRRLAVGFVHYAVERDRALPVLFVDAHGLAAVFAGAFQQFRRYPPLFNVGIAEHQRPVHLFRVTGLERFGQPRRRRRRPSQNQNAARVFVQTVDEARIFVLFKTKRGQHAVQMARKPRAPLNRQSRRLVQNDHVVVLVNNEALNELRIGVGHLRTVAAFFGRAHRRSPFGQRRHTDDLPRRHALRRFAAFVVYLDLLFADQLLDLSLRQLRVVAVEPAIDADNPVVRRNRNIFNRHFFLSLICPNTPAV